VAVFTSHNRTVYASPPVGGSGYEKPQSGYALCAVFLRHILARRNPTGCFMGGPKRHIQPERYTTYHLKCIGNKIKNYTKNCVRNILKKIGKKQL
jgi:hypothetical protein